MPYILIFAFLSAVGLAGLAYLSGRKIFFVKALDAEEKKRRMTESPAFFDFIREGVIVPFEGFTANTLHPAILKAGEKFLRRFRLLVLRSETFLHRLSEYFRARHIAIKNGNPDAHGRGSDLSEGERRSGISKNSEFWNELHKTKEELKNGS